MTPVLLPQLPVLAVFGLGPMELVIFAVIVLVLFGSRLPSVMRNLGGSISSFKKGMTDAEQEEERDRLERENRSQS